LNELSHNYELDVSRYVLCFEDIKLVNETFLDT